MAATFAQTACHDEDVTMGAPNTSDKGSHGTADKDSGNPHNAFEQMKDSLTDFSLPLVNLTVDTAQMNNHTYIRAEIEITDPQRRTVPGKETVTYPCRLKYRGSSSLAFDKKSFAVKLYDGAGEDLDANILGIREENSWILDAMAVDGLRMRNRVCFDVWNAMSRTPYETDYGNRNGTQGVFVELFINGAYHGLYCMSDKVDRKLLGLKKVQHEAGNDVRVRGLLYKGQAWGSSDDLRSYEEDDVLSGTWNIWELQYPDDYASADTWQPLMDLIDFCSDKTSDEAFAQGYEDYFYPENLLDYYVFTLALKVDDNAYKNTFLSTVNIAKGHRYLITPWDMDFSLAGFWTETDLNRLADPAKYDSIAPFNRWAALDSDSFMTRVEATWEANKYGALAVDSIGSRMEEYARSFLQSGAWERECNKWNGNPVQLNPDLLQEMEDIREWYQRNWDHLSQAFSQR